MQSVGAKAKEMSLFVGSEGYETYLDCQRLSVDPLQIEVQKRDYPDWYHQLADDEDNQKSVIYDTCWINGSIIRVLKIDRRTLNILDYADSPSGLPAGNWCIQTSANYIYVGSYAGRLYRFSKIPFQYVDYITLDTGGTSMACKDMVVDYSTNKLYIVAYYDWIGDRVWRVDIPTFTKDGTVTVPTTALGYTSPMLKPQIYNGYLYYPIPTTYTIAGRIVKIQLSPFSYDSILTLDSNDRVPVGMALYEDRLIVACITPSPWRPRIVKIKTSDFTRESAIDCQATDGDWCADGERPPDSDKYYFLTYENVVEIDLANWIRTGDVIDVDTEDGYYPICIVSGYT